jgi:alkylated DNA repair dioxygenase AlkB
MAQVQGLSIQPDVLDAELEAQIIAELDKATWSSSLVRRTQHYGYTYEYTQRQLSPAQPITGYLKYLVDWLASNDIINADQVIVNEYMADQGIGKHIDKPELFGSTIVSISLGAPTNFIFRRLKEMVEYELPARSLLIMSGPARYEWTHEIPKRKTVTVDGKRVKKDDDYRRISLTFRSVKTKPDVQ